MDFPYEILELYVFSFFIILIRISAFFFTAPVFGGSTIPATVKVSLALLISVLVILVSGPVAASPPATFPEMLVLVAGEVAFGLTLGFAVSLVFAGVQLGGMLMGGGVSGLLTIVGVNNSWFLAPLALVLVYRMTM